MLLLVLWTGSGHAQVVRQVSDVGSGATGTPALDDPGSVVLANTSTDPFGSNPAHVWQLVQWDALSGSGSVVGDFPDGVSAGELAVSLSDDGQWIAFVSRSDLTGQNHDESPELFVMRADGSELSQLTDDPQPNAGSVRQIALAGSGNRVAFTANTDPLGSNPGREHQVFVVDRDGTGLLQLTSLGATGDPGRLRPSISDDGSRVVFAHDGDPTGGNADGRYEVFAVLADGTGLRQLTVGNDGDSWEPVISGDGTRVTFSSYATLAGPNPVFVSQAFVVSWDGSGLVRVTDTEGPSATRATEPWITDDGAWVVYSGNLLDVAVNPNANPEIWKVRSNGSDRAQLTSTATPSVNRAPVISGDGARVAFLLYDRAAVQELRRPRLRVMDAGGAGMHELCEGREASSEQPELSADDTRVVFVSDGDLLGGDPGRNGQIYRVQADGSQLAQVTTFSGGAVWSPSVTGDGNTLVFHSPADPLGQNALADAQIFAVEADGSGLRQLTPGADGSQSLHPVIAADGSWVVFQSSGNFTGGNPLGLPQLFRARPDGGQLLQLTNDLSTIQKLPRVDEHGLWIVYQSTGNQTGGNADGSAEIFRVRSDGTGRQRITGDPVHWSMEPDVSGPGQSIVFVSESDPLGSNADHNREVFLYDAAGTTLQQLTDTADGDCARPRISKNGAYVFFASSADLFETDPDRGTWETYRVTVATGEIERAGALRLGDSDLGFQSWTRANVLATGGTGDRAVFAAAGDWVDRNPDRDREVYLADFSAGAALRPAAGAPTVLTWDPGPRPLRYDAIRGDVADLQPGPGLVDLGPVFCIENDSPDADTLGFADPVEPASGQALFYLHRGSQGLDDGPGSYGNGSSGEERLPAAGDCPG